MNKVLSLLGLAKRAGKVIVGTDAVISKLQVNDLHLIKSFTSDEISNAIGSNNNKVIGISDPGFAKAMINHTVEVEGE